MSDKIFLDSNILIYAYSETEIEEQKIARSLIIENNSLISTQVLQEVINILTRKFKFSYREAEETVIECSQSNVLVINTESTILKACRLAERYRFSFFDSLIIASALENECTVVYSEDLQHEQTIEDSLKVVNPFVTN